MEKGIEEKTGHLFGQLWPSYDQSLFDESVALIFQRFAKSGFDLDWFKGKTILDAGCGGGRACIAFSKLGAKEVVGIDLSKKGLVDARQRLQGVKNVTLKVASIMNIPYGNEMFDMVWCCGVLHHTIDNEKVLDELTRCLRKGGYIYLLVYATGGLRWPLIQFLRPVVNHVGFAAINKAIKISGILANKRRSILDDLFVPIIDIYHWNRLEQMLNKRGFHSVERLGSDCRLDHESDLKSYRKDLESLSKVFIAGDSQAFGDNRNFFRCGYNAIQSILETIRWFEDAVGRDLISSMVAMNYVIGQGNHRVFAKKAN